VVALFQSCKYRSPKSNIFKNKIGNNLSFVRELFYPSPIIIEDADAYDYFTDAG